MFNENARKLLRILGIKMFLCKFDGGRVVKKWARPVIFVMTKYTKYKEFLYKEVFLFKNNCVFFPGFLSFFFWKKTFLLSGAIIMDEGKMLGFD